MVVQDIQKYIINSQNPYTEVGIDGLTDKQESITILQGRGQPIITLYMDGSVTGEFNFDLRAKSKGGSKANKWLDDVITHFKKQRKIILDGKIIFSALPVIYPYLIERTEKGGRIYSASFKVVYDELP